MAPAASLPLQAIYQPQSGIQPAMNGSSTPPVVTIVSLSAKCNRYCNDILPQTPLQEGA